MNAASGIKWAARRTVYRLPGSTHVHALSRDACNRIRFGRGAPRFAERLWVDPRQVEHADRRGTEWRSGQVATGDWDTSRQESILDDPILQAAVARWVDGRPWEDTGEVERMERAIARLGPVSGCRTREDILHRCQELDAIFRTVQTEQRLRAHAEMHPGGFRELGGIGMHVGPGGRLIRAGNGRHRYAMAWILQLPTMPVRIGVVHQSALPLLGEFRREPEHLRRHEG